MKSRKTKIRRSIIKILRGPFLPGDAIYVIVNKYQSIIAKKNKDSLTAYEHNPNKNYVYPFHYLTTILAWNIGKDFTLLIRFIEYNRLTLYIRYTRKLTVS